MTNNNTLIHLTDNSFDKEVLQSDLPVLVDFWAEWCGPCQALGPIFADLAKDYKGKVKFAKLDIDANSDTPSKYGIRSIPTIMLFKSGKVSATKIGSLSRKDLTAFIDSHL